MATMLNLLPLLLFIAVPLGCASIIAHRMGRGRLVLALPWILVVVFSGAWAIGPARWLASGPNGAANLLTGIGIGGMAALVVSLIVLASLGVKRNGLPKGAE
jgi:hypothetical protein